MTPVTPAADPPDDPLVDAIAEPIGLRLGGKYGAVPDPTPEETRQRCAEVRSEWNEQTERNRRVVQFEPARFPCASLREAEAE